jgi:hypothetical protein
LNIGRKTAGGALGHNPSAFPPLRLCPCAYAHSAARSSLSDSYSRVPLACAAPPGGNMGGLGGPGSMGMQMGNLGMNQMNPMGYGDSPDCEPRPTPVTLNTYSGSPDCESRPSSLYCRPSALHCPNHSRVTHTCLSHPTCTFEAYTCASCAHACLHSWVPSACERWCQVRRWCLGHREHLTVLACRSRRGAPE